MGLGDFVVLIPQAVIIVPAQSQILFLRSLFLAADHRADAVEPGNPAVLLAKTAGCIAYGLADLFQNFHTNTILSLWGSEEPYKGIPLQGMRSSPAFLFIIPQEREK